MRLVQLAAWGCGASPLWAMPTKIILDTDMTTDVGDVVALCAAHKLQDLGEAEIVAVMHNTGLAPGVGAISVINHYYGRDHIPIGAFKGDFDNPDATSDSWVLDYSAGPYVYPLIKEFNPPIKKSSQVPEAVKVYRQVLAAQPDRSVVIVSLGFLGNLARLLASGPDDVSGLSGAQLVAQKAKELVVMGGRYPNSKDMHYEWNFGGGCAWGSQRCPESPRWAHAVVSGWPETVPLTFSGYELGAQMLTGGPMLQRASENSPCRRALELYRRANAKTPPSPSWDAVTTLYAVRGTEFWGTRHRGGHNVVSDEDGSNEWVEGVPTEQSYLLVSAGKAVQLADEIDKLLCAQPEFAI